VVVVVFLAAATSAAVERKECMLVVEVGGSGRGSGRVVLETARTLGEKTTHIPDGMRNT
jgi:hypothetical protein